MKGGQQDRTLTNDFVLPPRSGRVAISAFCVEPGRWTQRGSEPAATFNASAMMATPKVKAAAVGGVNQQRVWAEVAETQTGLASRIGAGRLPATRAFSTTSLQMTLEDPRVAEARRAYVDAMNHAIAGKKDVIGVVLAINGKLTGADVYASRELFAALWPKLLNSTSVEAVRMRADHRGPPPDRSAVSRLLENGAANGQTIEVDKRVKLTRNDTPGGIFIESRDGNQWIHRSYISKE